MWYFVLGESERAASHLSISFPDADSFYFVLVAQSPELCKNNCFELYFWVIKLRFQVLRLFSVGNRYTNVGRALVEWSWQGKIEVLGENHTPMPLCPQRQVHFRVLRFSLLVNLFWLFVYLRLCPSVTTFTTFNVRSIKFSALPRQLLPNHATLFHHGQNIYQH
jgi:hypothetical protein